jgi:dienelactone hydrolase
MLSMVLALAQSDASMERRRDELQVLRTLLAPTNTKISGRINATDKSWDDWLNRTGELPPDFTTLPKRAALPDPLEGVHAREQWQARRKQILDDYQHWVIGKLPPSPAAVEVRVVRSEKRDGLEIRDLLLTWTSELGTQAVLHVQVLIPPGKGPFPVFLTNHPRTRPWIATAVRRGYIGAIYNALDPTYGVDDDSDKWIELYPSYDWSCLARWGWAAMRTVDALVKMPEVDRARILISGHSRNSKQALIAAMYDTRISALVASSGNTGEATPWRYTTDAFANESIEQITGNFPHWFHPRLRFFVGREHQLPVDQNLALATIAPRGLLLASAYSESQGAPWAIEQGYQSVRRVYDLLGAGPRVARSFRIGEHPTIAEDIERYVDFGDGVFGRKPLAPSTSSPIVNQYAKAAPGNVAPPPGSGASALDRLRWTLGDEPAGVPYPSAPTLRNATMTDDGPVAFILRRPLSSQKMKSWPLPFGDDLKADFYTPLTGSRWPVVIWLHEYSYQNGYSRYARSWFEQLTARGYAVLAFDQIGFGTRITEAARFYDRHPRWSLMGKMIADTRAAVSAAAALAVVDPARIYLAGFTLGGKIALYTAALDNRVAGAAVVSAFSPLRETKPEDGTEGVRQYAQLHGLIPRLGPYVGHEQDLPIDDDELLNAIAPRPVLIIAPQLDRYIPVDRVRAKAVGPNVHLETPLDFQRFPQATRKLVLDWLPQ